MIGTDIDVDSWRRRIREDTFAHYHYEMAQAIEREGNAAAAIDAYQRVLDIRPNDPTACFRLASLLKTVGRDDQAEMVEARARATDPYYPAGIWHDFAREACEAGRYEETISLLEKAFSIHPGLKPYPELVEAYSRLAAVAESEDRCDDVHKLVGDGLRLWPDDAALWRTLGFMLVAQGAFGPACDAFVQGTALKPADMMMTSGLGWALVGDGRLDDAARCFARAAAVAPQSVVVLCFTNFLHCARHDMAAAEATMERAFALNPHDLSVWVQRAITAFLGGKLSTAETMLRHTMAMWPNYGFAESNLALVLGAMGREDEALEMHRRSLPHLGIRRRSLQRLRPWAATALAEAYRKLGVSSDV